MPSTLYAHGTPGSPAELSPSTFTAPALTSLPDGSPDLFALNNSPTHIVAFSLGAHCAIGAAVAYPDRVNRLTLIAPAAPLELGDFLPHMAGRTVFRAARTPALLKALTALQARHLRSNPDRLLTLMFRDSPAPDRALLDSAPHRAAILAAMHDTFATPASRATYRNTLIRYTRPWADLLPRVTCPVTLHHGTADTWAPPAMVDALCDHLPDVQVIAHDGLGHYSTLYKALSERDRMVWPVT